MISGTILSYFYFMGMISPKIIPFLLISAITDMIIIFPFDKSGKKKDKK